MSALSRLTLTETKLFFREPPAVFFVLVFPPLLLVILGLVPSFREAEPDLGGASPIDIYTQIIITMAIAMLALNALPQSFATYREKGILRRLATTPVRPAAMLGAQLLMCTAMAFGIMVVVLVIANAAFDVPLPDNIPAYLVGYLLCVVSMLCLGWCAAGAGPARSARCSSSRCCSSPGCGDPARACPRCCGGSAT